MVSKNPRIFNIAAIANRSAPAFNSSEDMIVQEQPQVTPQEDVMQSSLDIYKKLQGKTLTPEQKKYYFNNTKDIINPLDLALTDDDINGYLDNGDLQGLDSSIVAAYNSKYMLTPEQIINEVYGDVTKGVEWKAARLKELYDKWEKQKPLTIEQIADLRSDITAQTATVQEPKQVSPTIQRAVKRANRAAQSYSKYQKQIEDQGGLNTFADVVEQFGVGATFFRTFMTDEKLSQNKALREAINPLMADAEKWFYKDNTSVGENIVGVAEFIGGSIQEGYYSVMRGSNLQRLSNAINSLSDEDYNRVWDIIDNDPFLNSNLVFKGELIQGIIGTSNVAAWTTNVLELANTIGTPKQLKEGQKAFSKTARQEWKEAKEIKNLAKAAKKEAKQQIKAIKEAGQKEAVIKDLDYSDIPLEPKAVPTPTTLKEDLLKAELASDKDRFRMLLQAKQMPDGTWRQGYTYLDTVEDVIAEMKKDQRAVFQVVPPSDTRKGGATYFLDMYDEANKQARGLYPEFSLDGNWDVFKEKLRASAEAYAAGSNVQGDLNAGATQRAAEKLTDKIANGENLTASEQYAAIPEISAGAKRNTPALKTVVDKAQNAKEEQNVLEFMTANRMTPKDIDPEAFENAEKAIQHRFALETNALTKEEGIDLKFSKVTTSSDSGQGIEVKEIYGFGKDNMSPIKGMPAEEANAWIKGSGFKAEEINGDTVLTRSYFVPYDSLIATPLDDSSVGTITPYLFSIKSAGLDPKATASTYRARGIQGGLKGYLTERVVRPFNKLKKHEKQALAAIYHDEWLHDRLLTQAEVYDRLGGATSSSQRVWDVIQDWREVEKVNFETINGTVRNNLVRGNYKQVSFKSPKLASIDDFKHPFIAKKLTNPKLETLQGTFYEYLDKGADQSVLIMPSMKAPFEIENVDVYQLANPVFSDYNRIDYVVVPKNFSGLNITEVPHIVLGSRVHAGTEYADKYFVSFPRVGKNSDNQLMPYLKTVTSGKTYKEAESHLKKMQEIFDVMQQAKDGTITAAEADYQIERIALRGPYTLSGDFASYDGWVDFLKKYKAEDLLNPSVNRKLSVRQDSYSPFASVQVSNTPEDSVTVGNIFNRYHKGERPILNIGFSAHDARTQNIPEYINKTINQISTQQGVEDIYQVAADRFMASYHNLIDPNNKPRNSVEFFREPRKYINRLALQSRDDVKVHEALVFSDMFNAALGQRSLDKQANRLLNRYFTKAIKSDNSVISTVGELLKDRHPINFIKGLAYQSVFSLRVDQWAIQTALTTLESYGALPKDTRRALAAYYPVNHLINMLSRGEDISEAAKHMIEHGHVLKKAWPNLTAEGLETIAKELYRTGVKATQFTDIRGNNMMQKISKDSMYFFNKGNEVSRTLGNLTAISKRIDDTGLAAEAMKFNDWSWIAMTGDALSGGSSTANARMLTNNALLNPLTMMTSFQLNQLETFMIPSSIGLTRKERARFAALMIAAFGTQAFVDSKTAREWGLQIEDTTGSKDFADIASLGLLNYALNKALDQDLDIGRFTPEMAKNLYTDIFKMVTDVGEDSSPFLVNMLSLVGMKGSDVFEYFENPEIGLPGFKELSGPDKAKAIGMTLLSTVPGAYDVPELWYAYKYDEYINSKGIDLIAPHADRSDVFSSRVIEWITGIKNANYTGLQKYAMKDYEKRLREDYDYTKKIATKLMTQGLSEIARGFEDKGKESILKANHFIAIGAQDLPAAVQQKLITEINNAALNNQTSAERQILLDRSNPLYINSQALQDAYNRQLQKQFNVEQKPLETPSPKGSSGLQFKSYKDIKRRKK